MTPEENRRRARQWALDNPERYKARQTRCRRARGIPERKPPQTEEERKQKRRDNAKRWRLLNPDKVNKHLPAWKAANPERAKEIAKAGSSNRRSKMRSAGKLSAENVKTIRERRNCEACGIIHPKMEIDHKMPISRGGTNHLSNLQLLCQPCNRSKWAKDQATWLAERFSSQATV